MKIERIRTPGIVGIPRGHTLRQAAEMMRRFHVGALLVTENGGRPDVVGILTDRDLVLGGIAEGLDAERVAVDRVMAPVVATVRADADALEALEVMRAAGVRRLLVTGPDGRPDGMVSLDDLVDGLAAELASAAALMKSSVRREAAQLAGRDD